MREILLEAADEILAEFRPLREGSRVSNKIKTKLGMLFYCYVKIECGASTIIYVFENNNTSQYRVPMWCLHYRNDSGYACSNPRCLICSSKEIDFGAGNTGIGHMRTLIHGSHRTPQHLFDKLILPVDISIIEGDRVTRYINVTEVIPKQHGFELVCRGVNPVECIENYAVKKYVKEIWVKTNAFGAISSYQGLERVNVINPRFQIVSVIV